MSVPTQNDCTGDYLLSKAATDNYRDNYDAIFGKKVTSAAEVVPIKKESKSMNDKMREEFDAWAALERWPLDHPMRHAQKQVPTGSGLHMRIDAALSAGKEGE